MIPHQMTNGDHILHIPLDQFDLDLERLRRPTQMSIKRMIESLKMRGQLTAVIVTENHGQFILIDGFKRYRAAVKLKAKGLNAVAIHADRKQSKAMVYLLNRFGHFSMIQEAVLIKELIDLEGLSQSEASILLDRHKSWVSRRLEMIRRLQPEIIEELLLELIPSGVGPLLARIPLCNQGEFAACIRTHQLIPNEIRRLTDIFCKADDPGIKRFILQSPKQALSVVSNRAHSKAVNWQGKIQIMFKIIGMLEKDLLEKDKQLAQSTIEKLQRDMNQIKPILSEILTTIAKEKAWED